MTDYMILEEFNLIPIANAATQPAGSGHEQVTPNAQAQETSEHTTSEPASEGVAGTLGLDVTYFVGQLVTFSILLFILWKWVFTPVAQKLTERTQKVEKAMHDAEKVAREKQEFENWKNEQIVNTRHEASLIVGKAQTEAGKLKEVTLQQTKEEQQKLIDQAKNQILTEKNQALASAKSELADLVTKATEKIIRSKLDEKKDQELVKEMLKQL